MFVYIDQRCVFIYFICVNISYIRSDSHRYGQKAATGEKVELLVSEVEKREKILFGKLAPGLSSAVKDAGWGRRVCGIKT